MKDFKLSLIKKYGKDLGIFLSYLIEHSNKENIVECNKHKFFSDLAFSENDIKKIEQKGTQENLFLILKNNNKQYYKLNYINILFNLSLIKMGND